MTLDEAIKHAREKSEEQRKDYDTCVVKEGYGCKYCAYYYSKPCIECAEEHEQLAEWLEELKEYRDLEEQGLLLKLPCKVGDTLYFVSRNKIIEELIVLKITYQDKFIITFRDESNDIGNVSEKYIGKTVFLTKEEAEEKLKELNISERN